MAKEDYTLAVALEYAECGCLQRVVDDHGPLDSPYLETYLVDAHRGLRYVHSKVLPNLQFLASGHEQVGLLACQGSRRGPPRDALGKKL